TGRANAVYFLGASKLFMSNVPLAFPPLELPSAAVQEHKIICIGDRSTVGQRTDFVTVQNWQFDNIPCCIRRVTLDAAKARGVERRPSQAGVPNSARGRRQVADSVARSDRVAVEAHSSVWSEHHRAFVWYRQGEPGRLRPWALP